MTKVVKVKSGSRFENIASYSRLVAIDNLIFVSNTAGRNPETDEMPEEAADQAIQAFRNVETALKSVGASLADVVSYRAYVPNPDDINAIAKVMGDAFKGIDPASTLTCSKLAAPYYKFEIEVTAYRGASQGETSYIDISV